MRTIQFFEKIEKRYAFSCELRTSKIFNNHTRGRHSGFHVLFVECVIIPLLCNGFSQDLQLTKCGIAVYAFFSYNCSLDCPGTNKTKITMRKKVILFLLAFFAMFSMSAQDNRIASLSHNGAIQVFYGANALVDAYNASSSGDVITLSAGTFNLQGTISKGITIRGAGMDQTVLLSLSAHIAVAASDNNSFTLEGVRTKNNIHINASNQQTNFIKCFIGWEIAYQGTKVNFVDCKVIGIYPAGGDNTVITAVNSLIYNCPWKKTTYTSPEKMQLNLTNCNIINCLSGQDAYRFTFLKNSNFTNCIFYSINSDDVLQESNNVKNCYAVKSSKLFNNIVLNNSNYVNTFEEIFKTFTGTGYNDSFELTDNAAANFLGDDGTQVGMYGGVMPYDPTPTTPRITKLNVAPKSTADGKLSVEIEVQSGN